MAVLAVIVILMLPVSISASNSLQCDNHSNCICPGNTLAFVCSVTGGAATVWKGSVFNCHGNEILLRHAIGSEASGMCNNGAVVASAIEFTNTSYISQLNVTVSPEMHNGTVECIQDSFNETSIGSCTLTIATEINSPPDDIRVTNINSKQFTLHWTPPVNLCPVIAYDITTNNCGECSCPNTTTDTFATCTNLTIDGQVCLVVIQIRACQNNPKYSSTANLTLVLRAPSVPEITAKWMNLFTSILISFNKTKQFYIADGIDGSATSYTIIYSDSTSGRICGLTTIPASSCGRVVCSGLFNISSSSCRTSGNITVTAFATNVLGDGPSSEPIDIFLGPFMQNENTIPSPPGITNTAIYSSVGGIFFVLICALIIVIIILLRFLKKVYSSSQTLSHNPKPTATSMNENESVGVYSLAQACLEEEERGIHSRMSSEHSLNSISLLPSECCEVTQESAIYENSFYEIDKILNLDNLLIIIRHQVTPKWYQFGLAVGINKETLDAFSNFPPEECIVEMLDLWLRTTETAITWRDVANALNDIGLNQPAEKILKVYKTGTLPIAADVDPEESSMLLNDDDTEQPPLPPKINQNTS